MNVRTKDPYLVSLLDYEKGLRVHHQLGVIDDPLKIPMDVLSSCKSDYVQVTITPEVYATIDKMIPDFFSSKNVAWEYPKTLLKEPEPDVIVGEVSSTHDYYTPLIREWIRDNGNELSQEERDACFAKILEDFKYKE